MVVVQAHRQTRTCLFTTSRNSNNSSLCLRHYIPDVTPHRLLGVRLYVGFWSEHLPALEGGNLIRPDVKHFSEDGRVGYRQTTASWAD